MKQISTQILLFVLSVSTVVGIISLTKEERTLESTVLDQPNFVASQNVSTSNTVIKTTLEKTTTISIPTTTQIAETTQAPTTTMQTTTVTTIPTSLAATQEPISTQAVASGGPTAADWEKLRQCESGGNYDINTGNGYYGAYQFSLSTWRSTAERAQRNDLAQIFPHEASPADQDAMALNLYNAAGKGQWPSCGTHLQ